MSKPKDEQALRDEAAAWVRSKYPELGLAEHDYVVREAVKYLRRQRSAARARQAPSAPRIAKWYSFNGLQGCVTQWRSRATGTHCGLYHSVQAGMECDHELPWSTVCELHSTLVSHATLAQARLCRDPREWCDDCRDADDAKG